MDLKKYLPPLLAFALVACTASPSPAVEFFDGRGNVTAGVINITTDKLVFSDVSALPGSRIKNITPLILRQDMGLASWAFTPGTGVAAMLANAINTGSGPVSKTHADATYAALSSPVTFSELTITDFISAAGKNMEIGDITLNTTITFTDNIRQTFNPGATVAGLNVGSYAGNPSTPTNGDLWYNSTANELRARINGANVTLGAGGGSVDEAADYTWTGTHDYTGATVSFGATSVTSLTTPSLTLGATAITSSGAELNALDGITASTTELNYTDGLTSAAQTQLNTKAAKGIVTKTTGANYTIGTTLADELKGGIIYCTASVTLTIPTMAADYSFTVIPMGAYTITVVPQAGETLHLDGVATAPGDSLESPGTAGAFAVFTGYTSTSMNAATAAWVAP